MKNSDIEIEKVSSMISSAHRVVVVTGAGISTEAGIPDFRGPQGIYRTLGERRVMNIINIDTFHRDPQQFYEFYRQYFMYTNVEPSHAHRMLVLMERQGMVNAIVTQNIDNLHVMAGSKQVIAVHGTADRFICNKTGCSRTYNALYVQKHPKVVPTCAACGNILKPDVVLYGEPIQNHRYARETILGASLVIVIGSSLTVYPLAGFVEEYADQHGHLIIINKGPTALDNMARARLDAENTGVLLDEIYQHIAGKEGERDAEKD
jgi:NAD-dependent deacetylase